MSRGLSTAHKAALGSDVVYPALFAEFQFPSGTTRFWTGSSSINAAMDGVNTYTWTGGALIAGVTTSGETESIESKGLRFTLNGVDKSYYAVLTSTDYRGHPVKLWFTLMNSAGTAVTYPYLLEQARFDLVNIDEREDSIRLSVHCESRLVDLFRPRRVFMTSPDHQKVHADDLFYDYVPKLPGMELPWGLETIGGKTKRLWGPEPEWLFGFIPVPWAFWDE